MRLENRILKYKKSSQDCAKCAKYLTAEQVQLLSSLILRPGTRNVCRVLSPISTFKYLVLRSALSRATCSNFQHVHTVTHTPVPLYFTVSRSRGHKNRSPLPEASASHTVPRSTALGSCFTRAPYFLLPFFFLSNDCFFFLPPPPGQGWARGWGQGWGWGKGWGWGWGQNQGWGQGQGWGWGW